MIITISFAKQLTNTWLVRYLGLSRWTVGNCLLNSKTNYRLWLFLQSTHNKSLFSSGRYLLSPIFFYLPFCRWKHKILGCSCRENAKGTCLEKLGQKSLLHQFKIWLRNTALAIKPLFVNLVGLILWLVLNFTLLNIS